MRQNWKKHLIEYALIIIGSFCVAVGLNVFLVPSDLSLGGISALGTVFLHFFGIPLSVTNLVLNAILFLLAFKLVGKASVVKTVVGILSLSLFLQLTTLIPGAHGDMILSVVCGGIAAGVGLGLVIRAGGSTGGSDLAGVIIKKFAPHISVGAIIFVIDCVMIAIAAVSFGNYVIAFYSAMAMFVATKVADAILNIGDAAKSIYIMSEKSDEITDAILEGCDRGVTKIYSKGGYSGNDRLMLLCVSSPKEAPKIIKTVKAIDKSAFVIISDAREVLGEGFKDMEA